MLLRIGPGGSQRLPGARGNPESVAAAAPACWSRGAAALACAILFVALVLGAGGCGGSARHTSGGILLFHGEPLIPVGVYFWPDIAQPVGRNPFADIAAYGLDTLVAYYEYVRPDRAVSNQPDISELRGECDRLGIYYFIGAPGVSDLAGKSDHELETLFALTTDAVADSPHFVGWMFDEPVWNGVDLPLMRRAAAAIRRHAAKPLIWLNFAPVDEMWDEPGWPDMEDYARIGDIVGFDFYPVETQLPWTGHISKSRLEDFGWFVDIAREWAGPETPVWMVQQAYRRGDLESPPTTAGRRPNREETRFMAFQAIAHRATGVFFFPGALLFGVIPAEDPTWDVYAREVAATLKDLRGFIASPEPSWHVEVSHRDVVALVRRQGSRTLILAAREGGGAEERVTFLAPELRAKSATVRSEGRRLAVEGGSFGDNFAGYAVHIYVLEP